MKRKKEKEMKAAWKTHFYQTMVTQFYQCFKSRDLIPILSLLLLHRTIHIQILAVRYVDERGNRRLTSYVSRITADDLLPGSSKRVENKDCLLALPSRESIRQVSNGVNKIILQLSYCQKHDILYAPAVTIGGAA